MERANTPAPRKAKHGGSRSAPNRGASSNRQGGNRPPQNGTYYGGNSSGASARRPNRRKKKGLPPKAPILVALLVVVLIVVLCVNIFGKKAEPGTTENSTASSDVSTQSPSSEVEATATPAPTPTPTPPEAVVPTGDSEALDTLYRIGGTGYEYYSFVQATAEKYISVISKGGEKMAENGANVYNMIIPTSMDVMLPAERRQTIDTTDQKEAIDYIYSSINNLSPQIKTLPILDALKQHNNEYIYFRTDHHWTQLGAYYAYREFCVQKGITPLALTDYDKKEFTGFLGSFYGSRQSTDMAAAPDTVEAYIPKNQNAKLTLTETSGNSYEWPIVADGTEYGTSMKYLAFIGGDQPYEEIVNGNLSDGSSCLVIKESFGNAFVPLLVPHYQTIYVVDYRHYEGNIADLAKEKAVKDVVMVNNISMTRNDYLVNKISNRF